MDAIIIAVLGACASLLPSSIGGSIAAAHSSRQARTRAVSAPADGGAAVSISARQLEALNSAGGKVTFSSLAGSISIRPDRILKMAGGRLDDFYRGHSALVSALLWGGPGLLLGLGVLLLLARQHAYALACARATFFCEKLLLIFVSATAVLAHIFFAVNFLDISPQSLWLSPVLFLLAAAAFMRVIDMNYPFWNEAIMAMSMPVLASVFILGWARVPELLSRFKP